ncbi:unnamed protein product [Caretta caretta]
MSTPVKKGITSAGKQAFHNPPEVWRFKIKRKLHFLAILLKDLNKEKLAWIFSAEWALKWFGLVKQVRYLSKVARSQLALYPKLYWQQKA